MSEQETRHQDFNLENGPEIISFNHGSWLKSHQFSVRMKEKSSTDSDKIPAKITVWDSGNNRHGLINGSLVTEDENIRVFKVSTARNTRIGKSDHIKNLLSRTISEIVANGAVDKWISSKNTSKGAEIMYKRIKKDKRLKVNQKGKDEIWHQFVVTKK